MNRILYPEKPPYSIVSEEYHTMKEMLADYEQVVLRALAFDLNAKHPYNYLLNYCKYLRLNEGIAQMAWTIVNDSYYSNTICLRYKSHEIAVAAIYLGNTII